MDADWSWLLLQPYSGEATIVPPLTVRDYLRALTDPTVSDIERFVLRGQQETWRKGGMLATRLRVASALQRLDAIVRHVDAPPRSEPRRGDQRGDGARGWAWFRCAPAGKDGPQSATASAANELVESGCSFL